MVFNLFHLQINKKFPKEVKAQCSLFKSPNNRLPFSLLSSATLHMQWVCNHRLKNTILVTHTAFHLAPLTFQTKKDAVYFRENVVSEVSYHTLFCFHEIAKYKTLRVQFWKKNSLMLLFVQVTAVSLVALQYEKCLLCNSLLCQKTLGQGVARAAQHDEEK